VPRRVFTLEEAAEVLEQVRPLAEGLVEGRRALAVLQARRDELLAPVPGNGGGIDTKAAVDLNSRIDDEARRVAGCVARIHELGALVKGLDEGLVDFPSRSPRGADVLLCWKVGEPEIAWWHGPEDGFGGRRPLPVV
jgi:hypothetical protein